MSPCPDPGLLTAFWFFLLWLCGAMYAPFHFRETKPVKRVLGKVRAGFSHKALRSFMAGVTAMWMIVWHASFAPPTSDYFVQTNQPCEPEAWSLRPDLDLDEDWFWGGHFVAFVALILAAVLPPLIFFGELLT